MENPGLTIIVSGMLAVMTGAIGGHAVRAVLVESLSAAVIQQPVVDTPWPDQAYRVEWEEAHIPEEVAANVMVAVPVTAAEQREQGVARLAGIRCRTTGSVTIASSCGTASARLCHATSEPAVERSCRSA